MPLPAIACASAMQPMPARHRRSPPPAPTSAAPCFGGPRHDAPREKREAERAQPDDEQRVTGVLARDHAERREHGGEGAESRRPTAPRRQATPRCEYSPTTTQGRNALTLNATPAASGTR